jgi:hypothetical protein
LLDSVFQDEFSGSMIPCGLSPGGFGQGFFLDLSRGGSNLAFPPPAISIFQALPPLFGLLAQPCFLAPIFGDRGIITVAQGAP